MTSRQQTAVCILVYAILSLSILDWATTVYGLEMGSFEEGNPIMAHVFAIGYWFALAVKLTPGIVATIGAFVAAQSDSAICKLYIVSLTVAAALCAIPVVWNTAQLAWAA